MNIFGFLATVVGCGTLIAIIWLLGKKPISIKVIKTTEMPRYINTPSPNTPASPKESSPKPTKENPSREIPSMDAVIKAANALMGVSVPEEDTDGR